MEVVRQILTIFMLIVAVVLNVVILMQQSKESGLGSVFGGETSSLSLKGSPPQKRPSSGRSRLYWPLFWACLR